MHLCPRQIEIGSWFKPTNVLHTRGWLGSASLGNVSVCVSGLVKVKVKVWVAQSCLTLCNHMDCSLPGSSVLGILQARILE